MSELNPNFVYDEIDEKVWAEELDPFLPPRIFDFHGHVALKQFRAGAPSESRNPSHPSVVEEYPHQAFAAVEARLWPGREFKALVFGSVAGDVDVDATNAYAREAAEKYGWHALMVPRMEDAADTILAKCRAGGFLGLKVYYSFVKDKSPAEITLDDMITPAMREAADRAGLILTTHIPRPGRLADPVNIDGLRRLCNDCPNAKIMLAHFGRCYFMEAIGDGLSLADLPNLYPEMSMVQDWEVYEAALNTFDRSKIVFALDLPVAQEKGKCLGINGQRHFFTKKKHLWSIHAEPGVYDIRCTLFAYEMARAAKKASERCGLTRDEIDGLFWSNAQRIVESIA